MKCSTGTPLTKFVGSSVGDGSGSGVLVTVGAAVAVAVAVTVGLAVGVAVCVAVGVAVGILVGVAEGGGSITVGGCAVPTGAAEPTCPQATSARFSCNNSSAINRRINRSLFRGHDPVDGIQNHQGRKVTHRITLCISFWICVVIISVNRQMSLVVSETSVWQGICQDIEIP